MTSKRRLDKIFRENSREAETAYAMWDDILKNEGSKGHDYQPMIVPKGCWWAEGLIGMKFHICPECGMTLELRGFGPDAEDTCDVRILKLVMKS